VLSLRCVYTGHRLTSGGKALNAFFIDEVKAMYELKLIADGMSKLMTIKQVADALGVSRDLIEKRVRELFPDRMSQGETTFLDEAEVTAIKYRIQENSSLATSDDRRKLADMPMTTLEKQLLIKQAMSLQDEMIQDLQLQLQVALPKAAFFDQVADSKTALQMRDVAAALNLPGWGRNKIFLYLRNNGILDEKNIPYREFQDRGYFRVVERTWTDAKGDTHISLTTLVYQRGIDYLRKMVERG